MCYLVRDFPREKSLQAHLRTHTGERPYTCDYPNCSRAFVQSGQLKTHQRLRAGEIMVDLAKMFYSVSRTVLLRDAHRSAFPNWALRVASRPTAASPRPR